ncbi:Leishmanolysin-like peptidase [Lamellibrachia satsuma]|nr:Leishmanolysin-like peptidase [Lamellibrachia satsuma]
MSSCPLSTVAGHTFLSEQKGFECGHGKLGNHVPRFSQTQEQVQKLTTNTYEAMDGAERYKRRVFQSIRIHTHYDVSVWKLKLPFLKVVRWVIPAAVSYFQNVLKVHRRIEPINIPRDCSDKAIAKDNETGQAYCQYSCVQKPQCYNMPIPVEHAAACYEKGGMFKRPGLAYLAGPGVLEADYVLYIYSQLTDQCLFGDVLAYATCCLQDEQNFRPIAGMMNICPQHLGLSQDSVSNILATVQHEIIHALILATVQHEIIHALGFSSSLYPYYLNEAGKPWVTIDPETGLPPIDVYGDFVVSKKVLKSVFSRQWKVAGGNISRQTKYIVTPRVQEEVRRHFNCGSLEGAPLEDQGVQSSRNSHWEKRVFMNEIMTASVAFGTYVISRLTLALLEDTGWYLTDGNKAGDLLWGRSLGCDFVTQSCFEWIHTRMKKYV